MNSNQVWVVDDERSIRWVLEKALSQTGLDVQTFNSARDVISRFEIDTPDVVITDIRMPGLDGLDLLKEIKKGYPELPVIVMTAHSDLDSAVTSIQGGAFEYLPKPFEVDDAVEVVGRALASTSETTSSSTIVNTEVEIIGLNQRLQVVIR